jgi:hypothetical protein
MAKAEIEFHRHTHGVGIEDLFFLARDETSGRAFIRQQWAADPKERAQGGEANLSVGDFLRGDGERQAALLKLIGTLVARGV